MPPVSANAEFVQQLPDVATPRHIVKPHPRVKPKGAKPRVLLVEDEFISAYAAEDDLTDAGYQVIGAASVANDAIQRAQNERPDLILMDVCLLGERDGIDAAIEIYRTTGIRVVFVTGTFDLETRTRAKAAQPLGWLLKPYTRQALFKSVSNALQQL